MLRGEAGYTDVRVLTEELRPIYSEYQQHKPLPTSRAGWSRLSEFHHIEGDNAAEAGWRFARCMASECDMF